MIKMLVCDFDGTINGGPSRGVHELSDYLSTQHDLHFVIATGRTFPSITDGLTTENYPSPRCIISDVGTQIHHDHDHGADALWQRQLETKWRKSAIQEALSHIPFLGECHALHQGDYKLTFEGKLSPQQCDAVAAQLLSHQIDVDLTYSHDWFLDITPKGVNKATAIHYLMQKHGLSVHEICVAGDSANDTAMLTMPGINAILVANHYPEVAHLSALNHVYTSTASHAEGVLEGLKYWQGVAIR
ncbi:HAD family hydrolase [Photobacterium japonica]|uniref:HAD-IIB family hydrolase n=1 Tax=Photobacterium japonica TaxID=2910235 RepID=UPI003D140A75